jgi:hypothetical protein
MSIPEVCCFNSAIIDVTVITVKWVLDRLITLFELHVTELPPIFTAKF